MPFLPIGVMVTDASLLAHARQGGQPGGRSPTLTDSFKNP